MAIKCLRRLQELVVVTHRFASRRKWLADQYDRRARHTADQEMRWAAARSAAAVVLRDLRVLERRRLLEECGRERYARRGEMEAVMEARAPEVCVKATLAFDQRFSIAPTAFFGPHCARLFLTCRGSMCVEDRQY